MKLRKNLAVITTILILSSVTVPAVAASTDSESESWFRFSWFFSMFESADDSASLSDTTRPEK
jgi:hypothetical protein